MNSFALNLVCIVAYDLYFITTILTYAQSLRYDFLGVNVVLMIEF